MYFAILGRHPKLSLAEFLLVPTTSLRRQWPTVFFETELEEEALLILLSKLGGIVKWWLVTKRESEEMKTFFDGVTLAGVSDQKLWMEIKRWYGVRRFKIVEQISADLEVKKEGKECIDLGGSNIWLVLWRQDIAHFEQIDFWKPASGMEVGMMPSKLAQILVNIWVSTITPRDRDVFTIYDPFCGFGTTGFVANRVGKHFVGSDLIITWAKENAKRWKEQEESPLASLFQRGETWKLFTIFKHDVTEPFDHPVLKNVDVIVTEWRLGPVISGKTRESELLAHALKIKELYTSFLKNINGALSQTPIVLTIPHYSRLPDALLPDIITYAVTLWYAVEDLGVYSRKGQEVCRQIVVLRKNKE